MTEGRNIEQNFTSFYVRLDTYEGCSDSGDSLMDLQLLGYSCVKKPRHLVAYLLGYIMKKTNKRNAE